MTRAKELIKHIEYLIWEYEAEDPSGKFPTTPDEKVLDKIDSIIVGVGV